MSTLTIREGGLLNRFSDLLVNDRVLGSQVPALLLKRESIFVVKRLPVTEMARQDVIVFDFDPNWHLHVQSFFLLTHLLLEAERFFWLHRQHWDNLLHFLLFFGLTELLQLLLVRQLEEAVTIEPGTHIVADRSGSGVACLHSWSEQDS